MATLNTLVVVCLTALYLLLVSEHIAHVHGFSGFSKHNEPEELVHGLNRVRQLTRHFDVVHVDTTYHYEFVRRQRRDVDLHPSSATFSVPVFGKTYNLDVELNPYLLPAVHVTRSFGDNGQEVIETGAVNCYYQGQIRGESNSHAVLSTCHGVSGSFGEGPAGHWTSDKTFFIEPLTRRPYANGSHFHAVFRVGDTHDYNEERTCDVNSHIHEHNHNYTSQLLQGFSESLSVNIPDQPRAQRSKRDVHTETKYIELMIVADNRVFISQERNTKTVADRARSIANFVDTVYKPLNVRVPLVAVEVWSQGDQISVVENPYTTLRNFLSYRSSQLVNKYPHDSGQLITGIDMTGSTVGLAPVGVMCSKIQSGSINQDRSTATNVAGTIAHEMGHTLSMQHDDSTCTCTSTTRANGCIMSAVGNGIAPTIWSSCSRNYLRNFLSDGGGSCLFNMPTQLFGTPVCGNGFLETGEECDCGGVGQCNDPCCDAKTCRLSVGSQCSSGVCCQNCRFKAAGTECRGKVNSCDLPETCSGTSNICPTNIFLQNGMSCGSGSSSSYCYDGMCKTRNQQCTALWGPTTAGSSPDICYTQTNIHGNIYGNCGKTSSGSYVKCSSANVYCGTLFCSGGPTKPMVKNAGYTVVTTSYSTTRCKGVTVQTGQDVPDPGLVADGTICGTNSICLMHQCRSITSLGITPCPSNGSKVCSGNGACTNLNTCLCNKGWTGTDCSRVASGPINGRWGQWTLWSECSQTCGSTGVRSRSRQCNNPPPSNGGTTCTGASTESGTCNRFTCPQPINGGWSQWGSWGRCTRTCGTGTQIRVRTCNNPLPQNGGATCAGNDYQYQACNTQSCGVWRTWTSWSSCSVSCGTGQQRRTRTCSVPNSCAGDAAQTTSCMVRCIKDVDGGWSKWQSWGACSVTCGKGIQYRYRFCNMPRPSGSGAQCPGLHYSSQTCNGALLSCSPSWGQWSPWSTCPVTCGGGSQSRDRYCSVPDATRCSGKGSEKRPCATMQCVTPVNGGWTQWSAWRGTCTRCVGTLKLNRTRSCTNPAPKNGGSNCRPSYNTEFMTCRCASSTSKPIVVSSAKAVTTQQPIVPSSYQPTLDARTFLIHSSAARTTATVHSNANTKAATTATIHSNANTKAATTTTTVHSNANTKSATTATVHSNANTKAATTTTVHSNANTKAATTATIHSNTNTKAATTATSARNSSDFAGAQNKESNSGGSAATIGGVVGGLLAVLLVVGLFCYWRYRKGSGYGVASSVDPSSKPPPPVGSLCQKSSNDKFMDVTSASAASPSPALVRLGMVPSSSTDNLLLNTSRGNSPEPSPAKTPFKPAIVKPQGRAPPPPPESVKGKAFQPPTRQRAYVSPQPSAPPLNALNQSSAPKKPAKPAPPRPVGTPPAQPLGTPPSKPGNQQLPRPPVSSPANAREVRPNLPPVIPKPHTAPKPQAAPKPLAEFKPPTAAKPTVSPKAPAPRVPVSTSPPSRPPPVLGIKPTQQTTPPPVLAKKALLPPTKANPGNVGKDT